MLTPAEQQELAILQARYETPFESPDAAQTVARPSLPSRFVRQLGNVPGMALEGLMGVGTGIVNLFEEDKTEHAKIPQLFPVPQAETLGEIGTDLIPNLLGVAPQFIVPGGLAAKGAAMAGRGAVASNIIGQTVGGVFGGLSESPTGAVAEGTVGALQGVAEKLPRGARALFGLGTGAVGAAQAYLEDGSTTGSKAQDALLFGSANFLATFASPQVKDALLKAVKVNAGNTAIDKTPVNPHAPRGPIPFSVSPDGPKDVAPFKLAGSTPAPAAGIPFYETPAPSGLTLQREGLVDIGGGRPIPGLPMSAGTAPLRMPTPMAGVPEATGFLGPEFTYGRELNVHNAFAGVQPASGVRHIMPAVTNGIDFNSPEFTYGRQVGIYDVANGLPRAPTFGPESIFSPAEAKARAEFAPTPAAPAPTTIATPQKLKHPKLASGLIAQLDESVGWTEPGTPMKDIQGGAERLAAKLTTSKDIARAEKAADKYRKQFDDLIENASTEDELRMVGELANRAHYFGEAVRFAKEKPAAAKKVASLQINKASGDKADIKPRKAGPHVISTAVKDNDTGQHVVGEGWRDMHKDVKAQDPSGLFATKFDEPGKPGEAEHMFVVQDENGQIRVVDRDEAGRIADLAGQRPTEYVGHRLQSEHLTEDVTPPKPKPVEPATAKPEVAALEGLRQEAADASQKHNMMWGATKDYPYKVRRKVRDAAYAAHEKVDKAWEALYGSRLTGRNEAGQTFSEWLHGITPEVKQMLAELPPVATSQVKVPSATPAPPASQIRVKGKHGLETAEIVGETGDSYDIVIDDPIFGARKTTILKSEALPPAQPKKAVPDGGVPFKDVPGARTMLDRADEKFGGEGGLLGAADESHVEKAEVQKALDSIKNRQLWKEAKAYNEAMQIEADYGVSYDQADVNRYTLMFINEGGAPSQNTSLASLQKDQLFKQAQLHQYKLLVDGGLGHHGYRDYWEAAYADVSAMQKAGDDLKTWMKETKQYLPKHEIPPKQSKGTFPSAYELKYSGKVLGSIMEGSGPGGARKTLPGRDKNTLSVEEGLKRLPPEAAAVIGEIFHRLQVAAGQSIDLSLAQKMPGARGGMYELSGRIALNLQWINQVVGHWGKMSADTQAKALMRVASLFGHEITHVAQKFGERSHLSVDGKPLLKAIMDQVEGMNLQQRKYVIQQIMDAKGDPSKVVSLYLSGDVDAVYGWYKRLRPSLTREQALELAAGEFMAEIGAVELVKRMEVKGLPEKFRDMIDKFKQVIVRAIAWFKGNGDDTGVAAMQALSGIAGKMYDHLATADATALHKAFPASTKWAPPPAVNPFASATPPPIGPSLIEQPFAKQELAKLGVRAVAGAVAGGVFGPDISENKLSMAESVIAGGVLGAFGPTLAKNILNGNAGKELIAAAKAGKGNPFATLQVLTGGKNLKQLGAEARYGWRGDGSTFAKIVRSIESEFNLNLDPKNRAIIEQARGIMGEQFALIEDALKKARWSKPSQGVKDATLQYIEGKIDKGTYQSLLTDDAAKLYGNFMIAAREGTSVATDLIAAGMRKSKFRDAIIKNREQYVGRFYKAYRDGEFDMSYFEKVKKDFMEINPGVDVHNAEALLREHMVEIKANRRIFGSKRGTGAQALDSKLQFRRRATEEEIYMQQLEVAGLEHDPYSAAYAAAKAKLDWMETHKITDNWRGWLGEIKDPTERMIYTFEKVYPSSIAGKIFDLFDNSLDTLGNKFAYSGSELTHTRQLLQSEIGATKDADKIASLQKRLKALDALTPLPEGSAYGKLSGKFVDRFVRDQISTYDTPYRWMDQPVMRGIAAVNSIVKVNRTVLNPLTAVRNYLQMPLFMLMARVSPKEIHRAAKVVHKGADPELLSLMRQRHILGVDYAAQELTTNLGNLVSGYFDSDAAVRVARMGYDKARETYEQPDMLLRAGAFMSALDRLSKRMDLPKDDVRVIDAAVEATERVTMNYSTVPRSIKAARQLPFVSLFVSYTSEITKILKNLASDAISKDTHKDDRWHAIGMLGAMAAVPPMLVNYFEGELSEKDRADWKKLRAMQPDYARSRFYLPLGREKDGRFRYMDMTNMIPADNYTQMMKAAVNGDIESAVAANPFFSLQDTPLLNIATEQISGTDLRTGQPVQGGYGRVKEVLKEILPPVIPPGYEGQRLIRAFSENKDGGMGLTNLRTGVETRPSDIIANYLTGMRFANVTLAAVQKTAVANAQQSISHEQQLLRDTVNMNVSDDQKIEARNRYRNSVEQIMLQLHSRMGTSPTGQ